MTWIVYILECSDTSLYTGITNDLERRLEEHRTGRGAKYTKHRSPLRVRYTEYRGTKSAALTREAAIKSIGACPTLTVLLRRTIRDHLRRSRPEKILNVFQRIRLWFFRACGLASGRISFVSSRRQCRTGS